MNEQLTLVADMDSRTKGPPVSNLTLPIINMEPTATCTTEVVTLTPSSSGFQLMSELTAKALEWTVPGLIPKGELSILGGDGGVGKGLYIAQLVAYVTTGKATDFFSEPPTSTGNVVIFSAEDQLDSVLKPRLEAAGADLNKVWAVEPGSYFEDTGEMPYLDDPKTINQIVATRPSLVVFDPIQQFLSPKAGLNSRMKMREATTLLRATGREHGFAVLMVVHTNKSTNTSGRKRLSGSADLWDVARSVMIMGAPRTRVRSTFPMRKSAMPPRRRLFCLQSRNQKCRAFRRQAQYLTQLQSGKMLTLSMRKLPGLREKPMVCRK